jgi:hypothetical protein
MKTNPKITAPGTPKSRPPAPSSRNSWGSCGPVWERFVRPPIRPSVHPADWAFLTELSLLTGLCLLIFPRRSVCPSTRPPVSVCLSTNIMYTTSIHRSVGSIHRSVGPVVHLSVHRPSVRPVCPPVRLCFYMPVCPSVRRKSSHRPSVPGLITSIQPSRPSVLPPVLLSVRLPFR